jgi:hypothetical protein
MSGEGTYVVTGTTDESISLTLYPKRNDGAPEIPENAIYVAPDGDDTSGDGTEAKPFKTLPKLNGLLQPDATVLMRGGTYNVDTPTGWFWASSGAKDHPIKIWAYPGEKPIIDLSNCTAPRNKYFGATHAGGNGVQATNVSHTHWGGIHVRRAPMDGMCFYGDQGEGCVGNIIELCSFSENGRNGEIGNGLTCYLYGHGYQVLNCDGYWNYNSVGNGGNADGFQFSTVGGDDNIARGLRSWLNADDGYDFFALWDNQTLGIWTLDQCWAAKNGYKADGTTKSGGDGNGFKMGGWKDTLVGRVCAAHVLKRSLTWSNRMDGVNDNDSNTPTPMSIFNNTAWNNARGNASPGYNGNFNFEGHFVRAGKLRNNLSAMPAHGVHANTKNADTEFNSWDAATAVSVSEADFLSLDDSIALGPRAADGSLPVSDFLKLAPTSACIGKGTDVGIAFSGAAPDLGAYESEEAVA